MVQIHLVAPILFLFFCIFNNAQVAKLVDARDLKSLSKWNAGSSPALGTTSKSDVYMTCKIRPVSSVDRAVGYELTGRGFDSLTGHQSMHKTYFMDIVFVAENKAAKGPGSSVDRATAFEAVGRVFDSRPGHHM